MQMEAFDQDNEQPSDRVEPGLNAEISRPNTALPFVLDGLDNGSHMQTDHTANSGGQAKRRFGRGVLVFASGWVSNLTWGIAVAINRIAEQNNVSTLGTLIPAVGIGAFATALEYGMTFLATDGEIDMSWKPKRKITSFLKRVSQKVPLITTAWRGAASGVYIDALNGRKISKLRRLAHATLYGGFVTAWALDPGNKVFDFIGQIPEKITDNPELSLVGCTALVGAGVFAYRRTDDTLDAHVATEE